MTISSRQGIQTTVLDEEIWIIDAKTVSAVVLVQRN